MQCSVVGPEFISMTAGEAENPRRLTREAYSSFVWRLMFFFIGGALCISVVIPYNDKLLARHLGAKNQEAPRLRMFLLS